MVVVPHPFTLLSTQLLAQLADDFIDDVVAASSKLAKHRKSSTLDVKDVRLHLGERLCKQNKI